jgi:hypothetical protein
MATIVRPGADSATRQRLRVVLTSGDTIMSSIDGDEESARRELDAVIASLGTERFVRIGDDTIVRSDEVRMIQLGPDGDDGGFLQDLKTKITGGDQMTTYDDRQTTQTVYRTDGEGRQGGGGSFGGQQPWIGYGRRTWAETKPFFLTSEFLAFLLAVAAILIAVWQADNFEAPRAWLYVTIVAAAYIVSRGIAKAGTRDPNPNRGGQGGYGK